MGQGARGRDGLPSTPVLIKGKHVRVGGPLEREGPPGGGAQPPVPEERQDPSKVPSAHREGA